MTIEGTHAGVADDVGVLAHGLADGGRVERHHVELCAVGEGLEEVGNERDEFLPGTLADQAVVVPFGGLDALGVDVGSVDRVCTAHAGGDDFHPSPTPMAA